ncbi:HGGxSTG domain-containing protein [Bacillus mycoides]|uniref:HGGxSTG domain-containing protein n=1 Tax=Bacillus mycoides TaxID=1405 RepID=UPI001F092DE9|nr:HGGxSTG domain-containing protein [Bacillus mycoides]
MGRLPSQLKPLPDGLREYINDVRDRLRSGELTKDSDEMASIKAKLKAEESICGVITKQGVACTKKPVNEKNLRCAWHGGKSTGAKTEEGKRVRDEQLEKGRKATIHGLYQKDFLASLTEEEKEWYGETMQWYKDNYDDLDPLDISKLDLALMNTIKSWRKNGKSMNYAVNEKVSMVDFENRAIKLLDDLGMSRKFKKSRENSSNPSHVNVYNSLFDGMDK